MRVGGGRSSAIGWRFIMEKHNDKECLARFVLEHIDPDSCPNVQSLLEVG